MLQSRWQIASTDTSLPLLGRLRALRGLDVDTPEQLHDPYLMRDMDIAVDRVKRALRDKQKIVLFGDYDADGVTGTALIYSWLRSVDARVQYFLPDRIKDGYGLKAPMIDRVREAGADLLITIDNGTSANEALERAANYGMDSIIMDHHRQTGDLPPAVAVLNPNRLECSYPFKGLAAVGVGFKFLQAIEAEERIAYLDLLAIGTVADMAPMLGENRPLVRRGLRVLNERPRPGIKALREVIRLNGSPINARTISWQLGPRINCAGRLEQADLALKALLAGNDESARALVRRLESINVRRQEIQREALTSTEKTLRNTAELDRAIIMVGDDWHLGVIGLISGRITNLYHRPSIALTRVLNNGLLKGSARSVPGFDITEAIGQFRHLLEEFGGHNQAAGLSIREENLQAFIDGFTAQANLSITEEAVPELQIDAIVDPAELDLKLLAGIESLSPFGNANPYPLLLLRKAKIVRRFLFSQNRHLKLWVECETPKGPRKLEVICWSGGTREKDFPYGEEQDLVFELNANEWNGQQQLQLILKDNRRSSEQVAV